MVRVGVVVIDRDSSFRARVRKVLHEWPGFEVVGEMDTSQGAQELVRRTHAEAVLVDLTLPTPADLELVRPDNRHPELKWVVATLESVDEGHLLLAISAGAHACVAKSEAPGFIHGILHRVVNGEYPIETEVLRNPSVIRQLLKQVSCYYRNGHDVEPRAAPCPITPREVGILEMVALGMANKQIAAELDITERTVKNHLYSILRKLDSKDRTHAVYTAICHHWIQPQLPD